MVDVGTRRLDHAASWTAEVNAFQRAAETLRPPRRRLVEDTYSRHFVKHPALRAMLVHRCAADAALRIFDRRWGGLHAHIALRVRYVDDACESAIAAGISQLVLLGAGFDTTSLRRAGTPVTIFEVDAPATQAEKRPVVERLLPPQRLCRIHWVACDLERNALREALLAGGFDPTAAALVVWLGVTPYLTRGAIDATLADLAGLCAPGSRLVLDHIAAGVVTASTPWTSAGRITRMVARRGEPYRSDFSEADLAATLADHGFDLREHVTVSALLRRYDPSRASRLSADDWLAVATAERG
ncbi:SAM-dependent methyltransferase [Mycobacterium sp. WUMAC-067]|nr:SAM-dependent methyltransferase [Mycobacterium sp. WUMAC-067]MCA2315879.1 SAM-dependent methyltransferase [Mycobacterium sp. WUMAC-025]